MKNVMIILLLLIAGVGAFVYYNQTQTPKDEPVQTVNASPDSGSQTTKPKPKIRTKPKAKAKAKPARLDLPEYSGTIYVNGKVASGSVEVPAGQVLVAAYDGNQYAHKVYKVDSGSTASVNLEGKTQNGSDSWSTFQGNNLRTGFVNAKNRESLEVAWEKDLGQSVRSSPIILGDTAYFSSEEALVVAVDMKTGEVDWKKGRIGSSVTPVANERYVFASSDTGNFQAFLRKNGRVKGETFLDSYATGLGLIDETAFLVTTRANKVFNVQTRKRFTGSVPLKSNWSMDLNELWKGTSAPVIAGDKALMNTEEGLVAVSLSSGKKLWPNNPGATDEPMQNQQGIVMEGGNAIVNFKDEDFFMHATPASDGNVVYTATKEGLAAHQVLDGEQLWSIKLTSPSSTSLTLGHEFLYFGTRDGHLVAVSTQSKEETLRVKLGNGSVFTSPVVFGDKILAGSSDGTLSLHNAFSGAKIAESKAASGTKMYATPAITNDYIFAISGKGKMVCYR